MSTLDVLPRGATYDVPNMLCGYSKLDPKIPVSNFTRPIQPPDSKHISSAEFCIASVFHPGLPATFLPIIDIVLLRTYEEMVRIDIQFDVKTVPDYQSVRDVPVKQSIRNYVCAPTGPLRADIPITRRHNTPRPHPRSTKRWRSIPHFADKSLLRGLRRNPLCIKIAIIFHTYLLQRGKVR
jgi:hypothetical protein